MLCIAGDWHVSRALHDSHRAPKSTFPFPPGFLGLILPILFFYWCEFVSSVGGFGSKKSQGIALAGKEILNNLHAEDPYQGQIEANSSWKTRLLLCRTPQATICPLFSSNQLQKWQQQHVLQEQSQYCLALDPAQGMSSVYLCSSWGLQWCQCCWLGHSCRPGWGWVTPMDQVAVYF